MSDKQSNLTDKEMEDLQNIVTDTLASVCAMADKHNIDRDSMLKYFSDMLTAFTEVASIQNYETNRTNADRIRQMSDEELAGFIVGLNLHCLAGLGKCDCKANKTCDNCNAEVKNWLQSATE